MIISFCTVSCLQPSFFPTHERRLEQRREGWKYECKYNKGGKTLCGLYANEKAVGFMIIFGRAEREKVEELRSELCEKIFSVYDEAKIYHDGKWVMFPLAEEAIEDYM